MNDFEYYGLGLNDEPVDYRDPDLCDCGHYHVSPVECPDEVPCGDYRCCIGSSDDIDMDDVSPGGQINIQGANFGAIQM